MIRHFAMTRVLVRTVFILLLAIGTGTAVVLAQQVPDRSWGASGFASLHGQAVQLAANRDGAYSLKDLCQSLSAASGRDVIVDKRCQDRLLLFVSPDGAADGEDISSAMSEATGLKWRFIGPTAFLTYTEESRLATEQSKVVKETDDQNAVMVRAMVKGGLMTVSVSESEFLARPQMWGSLPADRQKVFRDIAMKAASCNDLPALKRLLNDPARLANAKVNFDLLPQFTFNHQYAEGSRTYRLVKLGSSSKACD